MIQSLNITNQRPLSLHINRRRIYWEGGSFTNFSIFDFVLQDTKKIFCQCYQNYLRHLWLIFFIFQITGRWFPGTPKGGVHRPYKSRGVFTDILATASRLNTLYGLKTLHVQSSRHVGITQRVLRHIRDS